jgi:thiamine-phosphate pyrophosphorylase
MLLKKMSLNSLKLYLILDRSVNTYEELFEIAKKAIAAGVDIIQFRDKGGSAKGILSFSQRILSVTKGRIPYIINDRVDLAMISSSSGVHLGQDDVPLLTARKMLGDQSLIGVSCQTFAHAQKAQEDGADYIGFGSVFKTLTKPDRQPLDVDLLEKVFKSIKIPVFAIGGIDLTNVIQLKTIGADRVAVCRAICEAENIEETVKQFKVNIDAVQV